MDGIMKVTEVRIKLTGETDDRLLAFCSVTFDDCFVVRDLKIIDGTSGPFVAMPSRKLTAHCPSCHCKNHLRSNYCNQCGEDLRREHSFQGRDSSRLYADIAHPINAECRELIQSRVIEEFDKELELSQLPGYRSRYDDDYESFESERENRERRTGQTNENRAKNNRASENSEKDNSGKRAQNRKPVEPRQTRSDEAQSNFPPGPHESPHQSEQSSKPDDADDQFGAGIL